MNTLQAVAAVAGIAALALMLWMWRRGVSRRALERQADLDERRAVAEFAADLYDRTVLYAPQEYWDDVIASVDKIRSKARDVQPRIVTPDTMDTVEKIQSACRELMSFPPHGGDFNEKDAQASLRNFRSVVRPALDKLCRVYGLPRFRPKPQGPMTPIWLRRGGIWPGAGIGEPEEEIYVNPEHGDEPGE